MSLSEAAQSGDRLAVLEAQRNALALEIESFDGSRAGGTTAPLHRQLMLVLEQIEALRPPESKGTPVDEISERRRARVAAATSLDAPEGSSGSG